MPAPFAQFEDRLTQNVYERLANVEVIPSAGDLFGAMLDIADEVGFDAITHATHRLRYPAGVALADGDQITIGVDQYIVAAPPRRINAGEAVADLVRK
jgi:hypothetical protein